MLSMTAHPLAFDFGLDRFVAWAFEDVSGVQKVVWQLKPWVDALFADSKARQLGILIVVYGQGAWQSSGN